MGGRGSDIGSSSIAFIHAADGESWANFLQKLLKGPDYNIETTLHSPKHTDTPSLFSKTQTCAVLVSPSMLEEEHTDFWQRCVDCFHSRTVVLLLGVDRNDLREGLGQLSNRVLVHKWLEMDGSRGSVTNALIKLIEAYEALEYTSQSDRSDCQDDDDDDVYDRPPPPRQQNGVLKVVPSVLYEQSGEEIVVVLERQADGDVALVTEGGGGPSQHIRMKNVTGAAYVARLSGLRGKVTFTVLCGDQILGGGSVLIQSRIDQLADILRSEVNPLTLLCSAMGVSAARRSEAEELDTALAARLADARLPLGLTSLLMPDEQNLSADQENSRWPTLLHFAAEYNLSKLCEELLRYPSMIHAAVTENKDGLFPCQLAERHGYTKLQQRLLQYVEDMRFRSAADSGVSVEHFPAPAPHFSQTPHYINQPPEDRSPHDSMGEFDAHYVDMSGFLPTTHTTNGETETFSCNADCGRIMHPHPEEEGDVFSEPSKTPPPPPVACKQALGYGYSKPRSYSDGNVRTPYARQPTESVIVEEDPDAPPPLQPKCGRSMSLCVTTLSASKDPRSVGSEHKSDNDTDSSGESATETVVNRNSEVPALRDSFVQREAQEHDRRPVSGVSQASQASTGSDYEVPPGHADFERSGSCSPFCSPEQDSPVLRTKQTKRSKSVQDKISHFFRKIKSRKQHSASEGDVPTSSKSGKKTVYYTRQSTSSTSSAHSAQSDPADYCTHLKKSDSQRSASSVSKAESERDSGAVCDDHGSPVLLRSRGGISAKMRGSGKNGASNMDRRQSVRVLKAKKEEISETPTIPSRGSFKQAGKESFVSFIK